VGKRTTPPGRRATARRTARFVGMKAPLAAALPLPVGPLAEIAGPCKTPGRLTHTRQCFDIIAIVVRLIWHVLPLRRSFLPEGAVLLSPGTQNPCCEGTSGILFA
jgi:hypothetical protein